MTMSTFHGLEVARKALFAQQHGLYTTGHNIANVNTPGYSRQRANFVTTTPYPPQMFLKPKIPGQVGTGVEIGTVQRIRDQFLDFQYRMENSRANYWQTRNQALSRMEELLNEPSENGLSITMDRFWQSLQDLADSIDNSGARAVVAQRGLAVAETFNHLYRSLTAIRLDLKDQIEVSVKEINSLLRQIHALNEQIAKIEPHGLLPNDLYDERDRLIDQLSNHFNIKVHYSRSSDGAPDIAEGIASIELLDSQGRSIGNGVYLIDVSGAGSIKDAVNEFRVEFGDDGVSRIAVEGYHGLGDFALLESIGSIAALVEAYGYYPNGATEPVGEYPYMLQQLNLMVHEFATRFNEAHRAGVKLDGSVSNLDFFVTSDGSATFTAENITVNEIILKDPNEIAAGQPGGGSHNNLNALALARVFDEPLAGLNNASVREFYRQLIGELGVKGQEAVRMTENTEILRSQVEDQRLSVSAVSLDEEMANLIKFQHAYNAAARNITALDEMLDRIINNMGLVGR